MSKKQKGKKEGKISFSIPFPILSPHILHHPISNSPFSFIDLAGFNLDKEEEILKKIAQRNEVEIQEEEETTQTTTTSSNKQQNMFSSDIFQKVQNAQESKSTFHFSWCKIYSLSPFIESKKKKNKVQEEKVKEEEESEEENNDDDLQQEEQEEDEQQGTSPPVSHLFTLNLQRIIE